MKNNRISIVLLLGLLCGHYTFHGQNISTFAGTGTSGTSGDGGPALSAQTGGVSGIASDALGNIYFCDNSHGRIRKVDANGIISTIGGGGSSTNDGVPATSAVIIQPWGIDADAVGNVYFTEKFYNRVRKINTTGIITTVAGAMNTTGSFSGDGGPAVSAGLNSPVDVAVDGAGNVYIADINNRRVRMVNSSGIINTIAGTSASGFSGDGGPATSATFNGIQGIAVDINGNIYVSDNNNNRIRKIDAGGIITTIAGTGTAADTGDGGPAVLADILGPRGIETDHLGNIYFVEWGYRVRIINSSGIINKVAGTTGGYSGDGGPAVLAQIDPSDVTLDNSGNVYIADGLNYRVRVVCYTNCTTSLEELNSTTLSVYPNPSTDVLHIVNEQHSFTNAEIEVSNYLGQSVLLQEYSDTIDVSKLPAGLYTLKMTVSDKKVFFAKFVKE